LLQLQPLSLLKPRRILSGYNYHQFIRLFWPLQKELAQHNIQNTSEFLGGWVKVDAAAATGACNAV